MHWFQNFTQSNKLTFSSLFFYIYFNILLYTFYFSLSSFFYFYFLFDFRLSFLFCFSFHCARKNFAMTILRIIMHVKKKLHSEERQVKVFNQIWQPNIVIFAKFKGLAALQEVPRTWFYKGSLAFFSCH